MGLGSHRTRLMERRVAAGEYKRVNFSDGGYDYVMTEKGKEAAAKYKKEVDEYIAQLKIEREKQGIKLIKMKPMNNFGDTPEIIT